MSEEPVSYMDLEPHLHDMVRLANAVRKMHGQSAMRVPAGDLAAQEEYCVMEVLLDRLKVETKHALEIWNATYQTAPDGPANVVTLKPRTP